MSALDDALQFSSDSKNAKGRPFQAALSGFLRIVSCEVVYAPFTFSACQPLGPLTTSNCTC